MRIPSSDYPVNRRKLHEKILGLQRAGKTEGEISQILAITPSVIQYLASLYKTSESAGSSSTSMTEEHRPKLAHEMWQAGKSFAEIGAMLQVSTVRARQLIHRYAWALRHPELQNHRKH